MQHTLLCHENYNKLGLTWENRMGKTEKTLALFETAALLAMEAAILERDAEIEVAIFPYLCVIILLVPVEVIYNASEREWNEQSDTW